MGGGVGGTPQGALLIFFPKPVGKWERESIQDGWQSETIHGYLTDLDSHSLNNFYLTRFFNKKLTVAYHWNCSKALWSPSSWPSGPPSSNEQSGTRSLWWRQTRKLRWYGAIFFPRKLLERHCCDSNVPYVAADKTEGTTALRPGNMSKVWQKYRVFSYRQSWSEVHISPKLHVGGDRGSGSTRPLPLLPPLPWLHPELWSLTWWVVLDRHETEETHFKKLKSRNNTESLSIKILNIKLGNLIISFTEMWKCFHVTDNQGRKLFKFQLA